MRDFFHNSAVYLLYACLAVNHHEVVVFCNERDDVFEIRVYLAIAACAFGTTYRYKGKSVLRANGFVNRIFRVSEYFERRYFAVLGLLGGFLAYVVDCFCRFDSQSGGQTYRGVCVYCEYFFVREVFNEKFYDYCRKGCLSDAPFSRNGNDFRLSVHRSTSKE